MNYKETRSYLNCERAIFPSECEEGFPQLAPCHLDLDSPVMIGFNHALSEREPQDKVCHFFIDDYQFERVWKYPSRYIAPLTRFKAVIAPDFSTYTNFPKVLQQFNHYRNLWIAKYLQTNGVTIIPQISFSDESSYDWVFHGQPVGSMFCLSTVGCFLEKDTRALYLKGVERAINVLQPSSLLIYGKLHDELTEALKKADFDGKIAIGKPQNFANLEKNSKRKKKAP